MISEAIVAQENQVAIHAFVSTSLTIPSTALRFAASAVSIETAMHYSIVVSSVACVTKKFASQKGCCAREKSEVVSLVQ
jgi:hypothetical protein